MTVIQARNVNDAYVDGLWWLKVAGRVEQSRLGPVNVSTIPVCTSYSHPQERVLFDVKRNANPFFHLAEAVWMMAGSNDVKWLGEFNHQMHSYSDDTFTLRGAYGERWQHHFGYNQLYAIIEKLSKDPTDRQAVLTMWDAKEDMSSKSLDVPCNTHIYFRVREGALDMTVMCRSNDIVWGAYGANAVHFSFLQEFMAHALNLRVGSMHQFSNNFHIYEQHWHLLDSPALDVNPYDDVKNTPYPLLRQGEDWEDFLVGCQRIVAHDFEVSSPFLRNVAVPMLQAWRERVRDRYTILTMPPCDWKTAGISWLNRFDERRKK